jgi:hypothetical protein
VNNLEQAHSQVSFRWEYTLFGPWQEFKMGLRISTPGYCFYYDGKRVMSPLSPCCQKPIRYQRQRGMGASSALEPLICGYCLTPLFSQGLHCGLRTHWKIDRSRSYLADWLSTFVPNTLLSLQYSLQVDLALDQIDSLAFDYSKKWNRLLLWQRNSLHSF